MSERPTPLETAAPAAPAEAVAAVEAAEERALGEASRALEPAEPAEPGAEPAAEPAAEPGEVRLEVRIAAPPERVFAALLDPALASAWMGAEVRIEPSAGGAFDLDAAPVTHAGRVEAIEDGRLLLLAVDVDGDGETSAAGGPSRLEWRVAPAEDGDARVALRHSGLPRPGARGGLDPRTEEVEALWALRLEALRARLERDVDLHAHTGGERHLHAGVARARGMLAAAPDEALAVLVEDARAEGEVVLSAVALGERGARLVTLRRLDALEVPVVIEHRLTRTGATTEVACRERGFASEAPWWSAEQQIIRIPALALAAPDEEARLEARLSRARAALAGARAVVVRDLPGPFAEAWRALTSLDGLVGWLPGRHALPAAVGDWMRLRAFADEPFAVLGAARPAPWRGLDARLVERAATEGEGALVFAVEQDGAPPYLAHLALAVAEVDRASTARVELTRFHQDDARRERALGEWTALVEALALAVAGGVLAGVRIDGPPEAVRRALTSWEAMAGWVHPSALPGGEDGVVLFRLGGAGGPADRVVTAEVEPGRRFELSWPWGNPPALDRPLRVEVVLEPDPETPPGARGRTRLVAAVSGIVEGRDGDRLTRVAEARAAWRRHLIELQAFVETGVHAPAPPAGGLAGGLADDQVRLAVFVRAAPSAVYDALLDPARPLLGFPLPEEVRRVDQFAGGRWETSWGGGRILRAEVDREVEHTFPAVADDEPAGDTLIRYRLAPLGQSGVTRVELEERGFAWTAAWQVRRLRQLRAHRFALEELRLRVEHRRTLRHPGVREALGEGAARAERDVLLAPEALWTRLEALDWLCEEAALGAPGEPLSLRGCRSPLPPTVAGLVLARRPGEGLAWLMPSAVDGATLAVRILLERKAEARTRVYVVHEGFFPERAGHAAERARLEGPEGWPRLLEALG